MNYSADVVFNGWYLKAVRRLYKMTQTQFSAATGIPQSTIARYESSGEVIKKTEVFTKFQTFMLSDIEKLAEITASAKADIERLRNGGDVEYLDINYLSGDKEDWDNLFRVIDRSIKSKRVDYKQTMIDETRNHEVAEPPAPYGRYMTPMYDSAATASEVEVYNDLVQSEPAFMVSIPQFKDCSFGKVIYGHSMYPTIESGTYVFCKPVEDKFFFLPGEIYYIEVDNFAICKRLQKSPDKGYALAVSDNDEVRKDGFRKYETFDLDLDKVRKMYLVKGYFRQSHN